MCTCVWGVCVCLAINIESTTGTGGHYLYNLHRAVDIDLWLLSEVLIIAH